MILRRKTNFLRCSFVWNIFPLYIEILLIGIITINFNEKDFYHAVAVDNLKALHDNVLEVLKASFTPREIRMRLREVEYDEKEAEQVFPL